MSTLAITFADELRARSDEDLASLFQYRPDLLSPVPNDFSSLAARASSTPSLVRALDCLNLWHYQIIEAACLLPEPFKKSELMLITSEETAFALDYLWQMGLLYKEGNNFRTLTNLKLLFGNEPAGLGPVSVGKVDFSKLKDIPKASSDVLTKLTWGPPRGAITNIKKPGSAIGWLLENNILVALDSHTVALPREFGIKLRGGKIHKELITKAGDLDGKKIEQKQIDLAAIANISTILRWCEELLHNLSDEPPTALRNGGIGVRDLKRIAEHLGVDEVCAGFVAELCYLGGLVVIDPDDQILPTSAFDIWLTKSAEERWYSLVVLWLDTSRVSGLIGKVIDKNIAPLGPELDRAGASLIRRTTLKVLLENLNTAPQLASLQKIVRWWNPQRANDDFVEWNLREAEWLGITGQGGLSTFGSNLLTEEAVLGVEASLPKPVDHILIQADNSAVAPGPLTAELSAEMGTIADIESRGGATVYRFSEASIRRGLDHGKTGDQIRTFLIKTSKTPMPQPLDYLITDVAKRHGRLRVGSAHTYIRCEDEGLVQQILHDKNCEHLRLRKIATQVLVTDLELTEVINELREFGYLPAAENASGVLLSQPNLRRAKSRPKPPRIISELTSPKEGVILSAVKAIRAGERSRKVEPIVSGTSSNETLALINQYISQKRTLIISYADNNGGVSNRIIEPISISLGTLTARDETTGEQVQFRIPRINGVAPSLTISENKADLDL
ncbi:MAG: helicase-associated domain-containing protein [Candidatus Nanopelagicus sp.]|nr:helicase-associated domain-containing protein [Candidatus Nanopelagicus sp.]